MKDIFERIVVWTLAIAFCVAVWLAFILLIAGVVDGL